MRSGPDEHLRQLDGIRALAVALVVWHHYERIDLDHGLDLGRLGVFTFFTLSGFLITRILLRNRDRAARLGSSHRQLLRSFYGRRALRIFPLYYAAILAGLVLGLAEVRANAVWLATYTMNFAQAARSEWYTSISHFWSLAVEEQFYLVWPFVVLLVPRNRVLHICAAAVLVTPVLRVLLLAFDVNDVALYVLPVMAVDALLVGGLFAAMSEDHPTLLPSSETLRAGALAVLVAWIALPQLVDTSTSSYWWVAEQSLTTAAGCGLVAAAAVGMTGRTGTILESTPLVFLGRISYGIYVIHLLLPAVTSKVFERFDLWWIADDHYVLLALAWCGATVLLAWLSWTVLEAPFNRLKRHLPYVAAPAAPSQPRPPRSSANPV